jgi:hypothetical protein
MANFQTVYAWLTLFISLMFIASFIVQVTLPHDGSADATLTTNGMFLTFGSVATMFFTLLGSIAVLWLRRKGAV